MEHRCFEANYLKALLSMYTIPDDSNNVWFVDEVNGSEVEWPVGAYLHHILRKVESGGEGTGTAAREEL